MLKSAELNRKRRFGAVCGSARLRRCAALRFFGRGGGCAAVEELDEFREERGFAGFEDDADLAPEFALGVHGFGGGKDTIFGKLAAGAEAAVELVEVGVGPALEDVAAGGDDAFDKRVGGPIEPLLGRPSRLAEKLVDFDAQSVGQLIQRACVRIVRAVRESCGTVRSSRPLARTTSSNVRP